MAETETLHIGDKVEGTSCTGIVVGFELGKVLVATEFGSVWELRPDRLRLLAKATYEPAGGDDDGR